MLYVQQFQHTRYPQLQEYQRLRSTSDQNFLLCSNQYAEKISQVSRPSRPSSTVNTGQERNGTLFVLTRIQSLVALHKRQTHDSSILNIKASNWNPHQSRITRENKDYMTALAKGLTRSDGKSFSAENSEIFSSRWHQHLSNSVYRPGTAKPGSRGSRQPLSAPERAKLPLSTLIEVNRPTTAPVIIEERPRRVLTGKVKSAAPNRPPPPAPPPAPLRAPRLFDSSGNFDNLTNTTFLDLIDGLKPAILKNDNHFVHQICSSINDNVTEQLNTSRDSFLDVSNGTALAETTNEKSALNESDSEDDEDRNDSTEQISSVGTWHRDAKSGRIEATINPPSRKTPHETSEEIERRIVQQEDEQLRQRQVEIDQYAFDLPTEPPITIDEYKSPFTEEYDQAIALQPQLSTFSGNNEWNLKDFYRDVKTKFETGTNTKAVFEKCIKLARLQATTTKWEQRRRQNMNAYNRLIRNNALDGSTSNLTTSFSSKTTATNNNDRELRELNELKRELRCNECKRITCLGNCAPGQDYHLYKRTVSSIPPQSSKQPSLSTTSIIRDQHRCKHGCTTCSTSHSRTTADIINANAIMTSLNQTTTTNSNRLRSSKTTYSYGQRSQRPNVDLRPRSMHQVTRDMKVKFEQAHLSPVVVVPLLEDESQSMLTKRSLKKSTNGLLPGKSFRSQRRDSLTLIAHPKISS